MANCPKCQTKFNLLYTVVHMPTSGAEEEGLVQMREGVYLDTLDGLVRLTPAKKIKLPFSNIKALLDAEGPILYFLAEAERTLFMMLYPEFVTWNL